MTSLTKGTAAVLLALVLAVSPAAAALAAQADAGGKTTVRVGYMDYAGFIEKGDDGAFFGYCVDFLREIGKYADWNVEYVYGTWTELLDMLTAHEIDLVGTAQYSRARDEIYDFSAQSIGVIQGVLYTRLDNDELYYDDFQALNGKTIGILRGSRNIDLFAEYALQNGFTYALREFDTEMGMEESLLAGELDAIASEQIANHTHLRLIGRYGSDPYYFMTYEGNDGILNDLNYAISEIFSYDATFAAELYKKHYSESSANTLPSFTRAEAAYITSAGTVTLSLLPNRAPFSAAREDGSVYGIVPDILDAIGEKCGIDFDYDFLPAGAKTVPYLRDHPSALIAGVMTDNPALATADYALSNSFYESAYPSLEIVDCASAEDGLQAVADGEIDVFAHNASVLTPLLVNPHFDSLNMLPGAFMKERLSVVGLYNGDNALLMGILNKCIATLSEEAVARIRTDNTINNVYRLTIGDMVYKYRLPLALAAALLILCFALMLSIVRRDRKYTLAMKAKNAELADAVTMAQRASRAKGQFLSQVSYEIRTPMNAITGLTMLAKRDSGDQAKVDGYLDKIAAAAHILLGLINDILDSSAIESGKLKIARESFDFKQLLSSLASIYYSQCKAKGVDFRIDFENVPDEYLVGDAMRVNQILLNLVSNAYKFTERGGSIAVTVSETERRENEVFMRFRVRDSGCGMDEEMLGRLFRPFEQESADTARRYGGSGLGMSIAKNLVTLMHGAISVTSEKGVGTTFTVDLPFGYDEAHAFHAVRSNFTFRRALIVDDDEETCRYTAAVLSRMGVVCDVAPSAERALSVLQKAHESGLGYDICFVDWKMPELSGLDVTRRIRALYDRRTVVIVVSAYDISAIEDEAKRAGADRVLAKPIFQSTVYDLLMALSGGGLADQAAAEERFDFTGRRILLADDDRFNREVATGILKIVHARVDCAEDGRQAVEMFTAPQGVYYDAILLDVQMPVMNGYETARAIRACEHPRARTVPIFAMTADAFQEDVARALQSGMNGHIAKPIDTEVLFGTLLKAFGR